MDGQPLGLTLFNPGIKGSAVGVKQAGLALDGEYTIEADADVGLPTKLDSEYRGQEGSKPFRLTIKAADYANIKPLEPDLVFWMSQGLTMMKRVRYQLVCGKLPCDALLPHQS